MQVRALAKEGSESQHDIGWIDTHVHLNDEAFALDLHETLQRAQEAGLSRMIVIACDVPTTLSALNLAAKHENLYCAIGVHPHEANTWTPAVRQELEGYLTEAKQNKIVAVGEIGLDYHYDFSPRKTQAEVMSAQLDMAYQFDLPVIIHDREAHEDCLNLIRQQKQAGRLRSVPGVFHCYSSSVEFAKILTQEGWYLGFDGPLTYKNAKAAPDVVSQMPRDRLLLETDCPYLSPVPYRGKRNEPSRLPLIGARVAALWEVDVDLVRKQTSANACRLFGALGLEHPLSFT